MLSITHGDFLELPMFQASNPQPSRVFIAWRSIVAVLENADFPSTAAWCYVKTSDVEEGGAVRFLTAVSAIEIVAALEKLRVMTNSRDH